jgi:hypothetical protein
MMPPSQIVHEGETFELELAVADAQNLAAYEAEIVYNTSVLEFVTFTDHGYLGSTGRGPICPTAAIKEKSVQVGCGSTGGTALAGPSGSAKLATLTFKAIGDGTSPLVYVKAELANPEGDNCCGTMTLGEGVVQVVGNGEDEPDTLPSTPTPNPRALTPTPIGDIPEDDGEQLKLPEAQASGAGTGSGSDGSGRVQGRSSGAARSSNQARGDDPARAGDDFPVAGTGPSAGDRGDEERAAATLLAFAGVAFMATGIWAYRRGTSRE